MRKKLGKVEDERSQVFDLEEFAKTIMEELAAKKTKPAETKPAETKPAKVTVDEIRRCVFDLLINDRQYDRASLVRIAGDRYIVNSWGDKCGACERGVVGWENSVTGWKREGTTN